MAGSKLSIRVKLDLQVDYAAPDLEGAIMIVLGSEPTRDDVYVLYNSSAAQFFNGVSSNGEQDRLPVTVPGLPVMPTQP